MTSKKKKLGYATGKLRNAAGKLLPIFSKENPSELVNEILREDNHIRNLVIHNPAYRDFLHKKVIDNFQKYKGIIYGGKLVDSWDRVTSSFGLAADAAGVFSGGVGNLLSAGEEIVEGIPKGIYSLYYLGKTGDWKALPLWAGAETLSLIPYLGDFIDMSNIYINRARKYTKESVKSDFKNIVRKSLEKKVAA
jgi:hypothetical protein